MTDRSGTAGDVAVRVPRAPVALSTRVRLPAELRGRLLYAADLGYDGLEVMVWTDPVSQDPAGLRGLVDHYECRCWPSTRRRCS